MALGAPSSPVPRSLNMTLSGSANLSGQSQITQPLLGATTSEHNGHVAQPELPSRYGTTPESSHTQGDDAHTPLVAAQHKLAVASAMYSFVIIGALLSTIGTVIPFLQSDYNLNQVQVSTVFLVGPAGYVSAAHFNHYIDIRLGRRGVAIIGTSLQGLGALIVAVKPPFPVQLLAYCLAGCGTGVIDGSLSSWATSMDRVSIVSGLLHGSFSIGGGLGPLLVQFLLLIDGVSWNHWYYVLVSRFSVCLLSICLQHHL